MKKLALFSILTLLSAPLQAITIREAFDNTKEDVIKNSKFALLEQGQVGWGWNLKKDDSGGPMALLDAYQYRFLVTSIGWSNPTQENIPVIVEGVQVDKLARWIAPSYSEKVRSIITGNFIPSSVWDALTVSFGPGWDLDKQPKDALTWFVTVNILLGGEK